MQPTHNLSLDERRNAGKKIGRNALLISLLFHAVVFFFWRTNGPLMSPFAAAGPRAGDNRAAGGSMTSMAIRIPPPRPIVPPRIPLPTVTPDIMEFEPEVDQSPMDVIGDRPGNSPGPPGIEGGTGQGDGGTAEEGLFRLVPPSPRGMIMPPANDKLKGREVEVWVFVDERGSAARSQIHTSSGYPALDNAAAQIVEQMEFSPAMNRDKPVGVWIAQPIDFSVSR